MLEVEYAQAATKNAIEEKNQSILVQLRGKVSEKAQN